MIHTITQNRESHTVWETTLLLSSHEIFQGAVFSPRGTLRSKFSTPLERRGPAYFGYQRNRYHKQAFSVRNRDDAYSGEIRKRLRRRNLNDWRKCAGSACHDDVLCISLCDKVLTISKIELQPILEYGKFLWYTRLRKTESPIQYGSQRCSCPPM